MQIVTIITIIVTLILSGCVHPLEESLKLECSKLSRTFFKQSVGQQKNIFSHFDIEKQYSIFLCGNLVRHPPALYISRAFAKEGSKAVNFLKLKLSLEKRDKTINDIIVIFQYMSREDTYNVAKDIELMQVIEKASKRVKDTFWKNECIDNLNKIKGKENNDWLIKYS